MIYLINTPGRTGSSFLANFIKQTLGVYKIYFSGTEDALTINEEMVNEILKEKDSVIHSHVPNLVTKLRLDPKNVSLIISRRKNTHAWILSHMIARHTKEYGEYTNKHIEPFIMDPMKFKHAYFHRDTWYKKMDLSLPYANISTVYHEDIFSTLETVNLAYKSLLNNIIKDTDFQSSEKSPYDFRDIVINWEELYDWYKKQPPLLTK